MNIASCATCRQRVLRRRELLQGQGFGKFVRIDSRTSRLLHGGICFGRLGESPSNLRRKSRGVRDGYVSRDSMRRVRCCPFQWEVRGIETAEPTPRRMEEEGGQQHRHRPSPPPVFRGGVRPTHSSPSNTHLQAYCLGSLQSRT